MKKNIFFVPFLLALRKSSALLWAEICSMMGFNSRQNYQQAAKTSPAFALKFGGILLMLLDLFTSLFKKLTAGLNGLKYGMPQWSLLRAI